MRVTEGHPRRAFAVLALAVPVLLVSATVSAERFNSTNYTIDASVGNAFGGDSSATSYKLVSSGGEALVGNGSSGSYRLGSGYVAQTEKSIQLKVQPSSLQLHFPMDEPAGTRLFDNTSGTAAVALVSTPGRVTGKLGQAVEFDGSTQYGTAAGQRTLDVDVGESRTISGWFKAGVQSQQAFIFGQQANCQGWTLSLLTSGLVRLNFSTSTSGCTSPTSYNADSTVTRYDDDAWHHVAGVIDRPGGTIKLYIDGQLRTTTGSVNNTASAADGDLVVAAKSDFNNRFDGVIDELKVFDGVLSDKAVLREYSAQNAGFASSLSFADITPNQSQVVDARFVVQTDAPGYTIALNQNQNLTGTGGTISPVSGSIGTPGLWTEGTTKGLGFTLTSGINITTQWGTDPAYKYAAVPGVSTSIYSRSGYTGGIKDVLTSQYRLDVPSSQPAGSYANTVTYTATVLP